MVSTQSINILGIAGSLRRQSASKALLRVCSALVPDNAQLTNFDLAQIPLYDGDLDVEGGPEGVREFKAAIADADALFIVTPEYNYSIPGVLKNAIDWASRPAYNSVLAHKSVACVSLAHGPAGGARAQQHLKQILLGTLAEPLAVPELTLAGGAALLAPDGPGLDEASRDKLRRMLSDLCQSLR